MNNKPLKDEISHEITQLLAEEERLQNPFLPYEALYQGIYERTQAKIGDLSQLLESGVKLLRTEFEGLSKIDIERLIPLINKLDEMAIKQKQESILLSDAAFEPLLNMIYKLIQKEQLAEAYEVAFTLLFFIPESPLLWMTAGRIKQEMKEWRQALDLYEKTKALYPQQTWAGLMMVECYDQLEETDCAQRELDDLSLYVETLPPSPDLSSRLKVLLKKRA